MGKLLFGQFLFLPLSLIKNIENQWAKPASSYAMGLQQCIGSEGEFLKKLSEILIIFCHWLSEIKKKNESWNSIEVLLQSQPAITCSKLTIETLEQGVKYVQS